MADNDFGSYSSSGLKSDMSDAAARAQDQAAKYGQKAVEAVDANRETAASRIESAAEGIRSRADSLPGGPQVGEYARQTADKLGATAQYLREHEVKDMLSDLQGFIKAHPAQALISAAVVGFLAGRSMRS